MFLLLLPDVVDVDAVAAVFAAADVVDPIASVVAAVLVIAGNSNQPQSQ